MVRNPGRDISFKYLSEKKLKQLENQNNKYLV